MKKILIVFLVIVLLCPTVSFAKTISISSENLSVNFSNVEDGYVTVNYSGPKDKVLLFTEAKGYSQNVNIYKDKDYIIPLPYGDGRYEFNYCQDLKRGTCYIVEESIIFSVKIKDKRKQYLFPNIWVNLDEDSIAVKKGKELTKGLTSDIDKINAIYNYIVDNIEYDDEKANKASPGYSPNANKTLKTGKGICSDYASLMAVMLRSQGIPTKIVTGTMDDGTRHAWISVYSKDSGEVNEIFEIKANKWSDIDPSNLLGYIGYLYSDDEYKSNNYVFDGGY